MRESQLDIVGKGLIGANWLYGKLDESGQFSGHSIAYIYNDLSTAMVGEFANGLMVMVLLRT